MNWTALLFQIINLMILGIIIAWPIASIIALASLRHRVLEENTRLLWAVLIVLVPLMGAIAYWIVQPGEEVHRDDYHRRHPM